MPTGEDAAGVRDLQPQENPPSKRASGERLVEVRSAPDGVTACSGIDLVRHVATGNSM
jgi:hypothetical protein